MDSPIQDLLLRLAVGLAPVSLFLLSLVLLDSYKLVRLSVVLWLILSGGLSALIAYWIHDAVLQRFGMELPTVARYVAPPIEEILKGLFLMWMIRSRRVGFLVDAAIFGFAVGTGFALVENAYYLKALGESSLVVWIVRGFGTAIMHGGTTAILAIVSKTLTERTGSESPLMFVPGLVMATLIHSFYNHFVVTPILMTAAVVLSLVPLFLIVFRKSEDALRGWLDFGFDSDVELLELIRTGNIGQTPIGKYLFALRERFPGTVIADMLCYLRLHVELGLRAKGILLMRESGFDAPLEPEIREKLDELSYLERSLGPTGRLALDPILRRRSQDVWQLHLLDQG